MQPQLAPPYHFIPTPSEPLHCLVLPPPIWEPFFGHTAEKQQQQQQSQKVNVHFMRVYICVCVLCYVAFGLHYG